MSMSAPEIRALTRSVGTKTACRSYPAGPFFYAKPQIYIDGIGGVWYILANQKY